MKIFPLLFLFIAVTSEAFTQIKKGQYLLGGSIRFESVKEEYPYSNAIKSNNFFISPAIGYFIINKLAGGLRIDFSSYNPKSDTVETQSNSTTFSPFVRYYLLPVAKKVNAFIDVGYVQTKSKWRVLPNSGYYAHSKGFQISAGPAIFLTEQIALEFIVAFRHTESNDYPGLEPAKFNKLSSGLGLQMQFGKMKTKRDS